MYAIIDSLNSLRQLKIVSTDLVNQNNYSKLLLQILSSMCATVHTARLAHHAYAHACTVGSNSHRRARNWSVLLSSQSNSSPDWGWKQRGHPQHCLLSAQ